MPSVVIKNEVLGMPYFMSVQEQRVLVAAISRLDSRAKHNSETWIEITSDDMRKLFPDLKGSAVYRTLNDGARKLKRRISVSRFTDKRIRCEHEYSWFQDVEYRPGQGRLLVRFSATASENLTGIKDNFTKYDTDQVASFKSRYSFRFYEWFVKHKKLGTLNLSIDTIRARLALSDSYDTPSILRRDVIEKAVDEVNRYTDLYIEIETDIDGRKTKGYTFTIQEKRKMTEQSKDQAIESIKSSVQSRNGQRQMSPEQFEKERQRQLQALEKLKDEKNGQTNVETEKTRPG